MAGFHVREAELRSALSTYIPSPTSTPAPITITLRACLLRCTIGDGGCHWLLTLFQVFDCLCSLQVLLELQYERLGVQVLQADQSSLPAEHVP